MFGLIATDIAGRTLLASQTGIPTADDSPNDLRLPESNHPTIASIQVGPTRSPPPKRTREGDAMTPATIATTPDTTMDTSMDETSSCLDTTLDAEEEGTFDADTSILDTTFEDADDEDEDSDVSVGMPLSSAAQTALNRRLEEVYQEDLITQTPTQIEVPHTQETPQLTQPSRPPPQNAAPAPLAPQYTSDTGLAGATDT